MEKHNLSAEELALETEATQEVKEDEIRQSVITDYSFDETTDGERIDKLVAKEVENRKKLSQAIGQKRKYREEAEKAKNNPPQKDSKQEKGLSVKDLHALKDVHEDDVDDVLEYAELKKISISDAKKSTIVQTILADKVEKRKTAEATPTGATRPVSKKLDGNTLNKNLKEKGEIPEPGSAEAEALYRARRGLKE